MNLLYPEPSSFLFDLFFSLLCLFTQANYYFKVFRLFNYVTERTLNMEATKIPETSHEEPRTGGQRCSP